MTNEVQEQITKVTVKLIQSINELEDIISLAITARNAKANDSSFLVLANNLSVSVTSLLQRKGEMFNEKAHESKAQAQFNHDKAGSAMWHSENELRYSVIAETISDMALCWESLCKDYHLRTDWNDLNKDNIKTKASTADVNVVRKKLGLEPLQGK